MKLIDKYNMHLRSDEADIAAELIVVQAHFMCKAKTIWRIQRAATFLQQLHEEEAINDIIVLARERAYLLRSKKLNNADIIKKEMLKKARAITSKFQF